MNNENKNIKKNSNDRNFNSIYIYIIYVNM